MPRTSAEVWIDLKRDDLKSISNPTTDSNNPIADINNLKLDDLEYKDFMTLEHNMNILDESLVYFEDTQKLSYFSNNLSDDSCNTSDEINIYFDSSQSVAGLIFDFGYMRSAYRLFVYYMLGDDVIYSANCYVSGRLFTFDKVCDGFNRIRIVFVKTKFPGTYNRLQNLKYGYVYKIENRDIVELSITEEVHPISAFVPINTCDITISDKNNFFNLLTPQEIFKLFTRGIKFDIYGYYNNTKVSYGSYYLESWDVSSPYMPKFSLVSILGTLDNQPYEEAGLVSYYGLTTVYDELYKIFELLDMEENVDYTLSEELKDTKVIGLIPKGSYKNAIQYLAFTAGAMVNDTRDGMIKIYRQQKGSKYTLSGSDIFQDSKVSQNEIISGFNITVKNYDVQNDENAYSKIFEGLLDDDTTTRFNVTEPIYAVRYKTSKNPNYVTYSSFTIGKFYFDFYANDSETLTYTIEVAYFKASDIVKHYDSQNELKSYDHVMDISSNTLLYDDGSYWGFDRLIGNVDDFAKRVNSFYMAHPLKYEFSYISNGNYLCGDKGAVFTEFDQYLQGTIIKQKIDLAKGHISDVSFACSNKNLTYYYYATSDSNDLTSNDNFLI